MSAAPAATPLWRQTPFVLLMVSRLFSNIGTQMQTVAVGWQVYTKTHSPLDLGWVGLSQFAPFVVLILPAGIVADRFDRRRIMALCYGVQMLCAIALAIYTASAAAPVWPIFLIMTLIGVARAFANPASQSILPNLVTRERLGQAVAFNSSMTQTSNMIGPMVGGLLLLMGLNAVYLMVVVCALICMVAIGNVRYAPVTPRVLPTVAASESRLTALLAGLKFVRDNPLVLGAISLDLFAVLFGGATALLPIYASDILHVGPSGLGLLRSAPGAGALIGALSLSVFPIKRHAGTWLFGSVMVFGLATVIFGGSTRFWLSIVALIVLGASDIISVFVRIYLVQLVTPDVIRGRVSAVFSVFVGASNELGEFESGTTAAWWGTVPSVIVGGSITMLVTLLWLKLFPSLRRMDKFPEPTR